MFAELGLTNGRQKKFKKFLDSELLKSYNSSALIKNHGGFAGPRYILHDRIIDNYNTIQKNTVGSGAQTIETKTLAQAVKVDKIFNHPDLSLKKDAADRIAKGKQKFNIKDVTPKGYGPKEEVEIDEIKIMGSLDSKERNKPGEKRVRKNFLDIIKGLFKKEEYELVESAMKEFHMMVQDGKSAEEIARALRIDVKSVKTLMKGMNEGFENLTEEELEEASAYADASLSLIHISEPTRRTPMSYAVFC